MRLVKLYRSLFLQIYDLYYTRFYIQHSKSTAYIFIEVPYKKI